MLVKLENESLCASIDTLGAQLVSLKDKSGQEYIWERDPAVWKNCSPILFPIVGNLRGDQALIEGKICRIEKHGPCKHTEFSVAKQEEKLAIFSLADAGYEPGGYPYHCELQVQYQLTGSSLEMKLTVQNTDTKNVSYCLGFHTGFRCPMQKNESFEDYELLFTEKETEGYRRYDVREQAFDRHTMLPFPGEDGKRIPLKRTLFLDDAIWFEKVRSREVILKKSTGTAGIRVSYPDFTSLALWTLPAEEASFLCIEPWNGSAVCLDEDDVFAHKHDLQTLSPAEKRSYTMEITVL